MSTTQVEKAPVVYPSSDGKPMAENTIQFRWIQVLAGNLMALFRLVANVFVGGDLLWYPVEGDEKTRNAPDVFVVCGRPKGDRSSYIQHEEDNVPMTVVFEILSPGNSQREMDEKFQFYDEHGVEEYYLFDPERNTLRVWVRGQMILRLMAHQGVFTSPRLQIRFDLTQGEMQVFHPDGSRFLSFEELMQLQIETEEQFSLVKVDLTQTKLKLSTAEQKLSTAEQKLATTTETLARIRMLSRKARQGLATAEELGELDRLEADDTPT